jgi:hypothetical protein
VRIRMAGFTTFLALLGILAISPKTASAQQVPGPHPAYLHALSDLRLARAFLDQIAWPPVQRDEEHAIREIDAAIGEIKRASIDDGKNLEDHPPIDTRMRPDGRFRRPWNCWIRRITILHEPRMFPRRGGCGIALLSTSTRLTAPWTTPFAESVGKSGEACSRSSDGMTDLIGLSSQIDTVTVSVYRESTLLC